MTELTDIILVDPIQQKYNEINEYFNGKLPNPIHEPIKFNYYLRLYDFYQKRANRNATE